MRSHLYVSGDAPRMLAAALTHGADSIIVDLAHPPAGPAPSAPGSEAARAAAARSVAARWLRAVPAGAPVWVRINPGPLGHEDARAVVGPGLRGLCLARAESPTQLRALDAVLCAIEADAGLPARSVAVAPVLESAAALLAAPSIARAPRVARLHLVEAALRGELGVDPSDDDRELLYPRSTVVLASAAAGIEAPVGPPCPDAWDGDRLRASTESLRRLGYRGRACLRPDQVPVINDVFAPTRAPTLVSAGLG